VISFLFIQLRHFFPPQKYLSGAKQKSVLSLPALICSLFMTNFFGITRTHLYYAGLALMLIALPLSKFLMSVSQFGLVAVWLLDKKILNKWRRFFRNPTAMLLVSVYLLYVVGLLWTTDFDYALKDLRTKLPLLALPVIISTSPRVGGSLFYWLMLLFIAANVVGTFFSMHELLTKEITEIRKISLFMSHIRFSLNICVAIFAGLYLVFGVRIFDLWARIVIFAAVVWLAIFLVILESVTGIVILLITLAVLALIFIFIGRSQILKYSILMALLAAVLVLFFYIRALYLEYIPEEPFFHPGLEQTTKLGNPYHHDSTLKGAENGHWVGQYIQMTELRTSWQQRSSIPFDSLDAGGNHVRFTLIRYLTSKGLRKDAEGVAALTDADIRYIEKGYATVYQPVETSFTNRIRTIIWEVMLYKYSGYLSGHSVAQRIEFWRAGFHIIHNNFWLGTGTGDIREAFQTSYEELNSQLEPQFRWRTHNQYFSVLATLGIFALLWFLYALIWPGIFRGMYTDYFFLTFFCILTLSMLTEDTIENQAGATFFAFFMSFLLLARSHKDQFFNIKT
jgi:hypothetical protein